MPSTKWYRICLELFSLHIAIITSYQSKSKLLSTENYKTYYKMHSTLQAGAETDRSGELGIAAPCKLAYSSIMELSIT